MIAQAPWLIRTEDFASRPGSAVAVWATSIPTAAGVDVSAFGAWHLGALSRRHPGLLVSELESFDSDPASLLRYGTVPGDDPSHLVEVFGASRGMLRAVVAEGPMSESLEALCAEAREWMWHDATLHLTVEEFSTIERVLGVPHAAFVARSSLIDQDHGQPGGLIDTVARSLALRGILQQDAEGAWSLTWDRGAIVAPLMGSRSAAWLTGEGPDGIPRSAAFGRNGDWSLVKPDQGGGVVVTVVEDFDLAFVSAGLMGLAPDSPAPTGEPVRVSRSASSDVQVGSTLDGIGVVTSTSLARFVRSSGAGLEQLEFSWLTVDGGGWWMIVDHDVQDVVIEPVSVETVVSRLAEGFEEGEGDDVGSD